MLPAPPAGPAHMKHAKALTNDAPSAVCRHLQVGPVVGAALHVRRDAGRQHRVHRRRHRWHLPVRLGLPQPVRVHPEQPRGRGPRRVPRGGARQGLHVRAGRQQLPHHLLGRAGEASCGVLSAWSMLACGATRGGVMAWTSLRMCASCKHLDVLGKCGAPEPRSGPSWRGVVCLHTCLYMRRLSMRTKVCQD